MFERTLDDEIAILNRIKDNPCSSCHHESNSHDDFCYMHCVGKGDRPGYCPKNQTYDWRKFEKVDSKKYAKKILKDRAKMIKETGTWHV